jgi:predicted small metal-binding protein
MQARFARRYILMRAVDCPCGEHVEADTDARVLEAIKEHADDEHPGKYQEVELRLLVNTAAYDAAA